MGRERILPTLFVSHGAPTQVLAPGALAPFYEGLRAELPEPRAILCVSAHWETGEPTLTGAERPDTIHDFLGFPDALYRMRYPAPGDPELAGQVRELLKGAGFRASIDPARGLDHGAWTPLVLLYPRAHVPVLQLSVQPGRGADRHLALGVALAPLREDGVLVLASGSATHDLSAFRGQPVDAPPVQYAMEFDRWLDEAVAGDERRALVAWEREGPHARRNHPTTEHFVPLLVAMGAAGGDARGERIHSGFTYGILSMAAFAWR